VVGFELVDAAVEDARANAARNGLEGVRFVAGDLALTLAPEQLALRGLPRPDVCVVDPPRAGLHARVLDSLRLLEPRRIVYVSCNPRAAVQDLAALVEAGYRLEGIQPVDLFPHTPHLECVFRLERGPQVATAPESP
jgi:23S rRNA (uracil1939-C5)-methyltransferase